VRRDDTRNRLTAIEYKDCFTVLGGFYYEMDDTGNITKTGDQLGGHWAASAFSMILLLKQYLNKVRASSHETSAVALIGARGDFERAAMHLDEAVRLNPGSSMAWGLKAIVELYRGRLNVAGEAAERSLLLNSDCILSAACEAVVLDAKGLNREACNAYDAIMADTDSKSSLIRWVVHSRLEVLAKHQEC